MIFKILNRFLKIEPKIARGRFLNHSTLILTSLLTHSRCYFLKYLADVITDVSQIARCR